MSLWCPVSILLLSASNEGGMIKRNSSECFIHSFNRVYGEFRSPLIGKSRRCPKPHSNSLNCDFPDERVAADNLPDSYRVNQPSSSSNTIIGNVLVIISVFTYRPPQNMFIVSPGGGGHHRRRPGDAAKSRLHPHVPVEVRTASLQRCGSRATSCAARPPSCTSPPSPWTGTGRSTIPSTTPARGL
ncbi:hypothetical protein CEXT_587281 [Caerostris extrusa]|uniref:Secreted protein n=1 Tax=Caerostris extrusa TaxID=172846 RepID=A0AAV4RK77_CAEEX|nr:hypothetical protein CEXT_587281 [Caerostris extrusa]